MIRLHLPWLPPSSNNAYTNNGFGGRKLSAEGRKFLVETKTLLAQTYRREMLIFKPNKPYLVVMYFYFDALETKGWAKGKANRYKKVDGGNRTKLLEDALAEAGGFDDSQTLTSIWSKMEAVQEHTVLLAWSLEEESTPFDDILRDLR